MSTENKKIRAELNTHLNISPIEVCGSEIKCIYCNTKIDKFESEHSEGHHYKTAECPGCGKNLCVKVSFQGSGHDEFESDLEKGIKEVKDLRISGHGVTMHHLKKREEDKK